MLVNLIVVVSPDLALQLPLAFTLNVTLNIVLSVFIVIESTFCLSTANFPSLELPSISLYVTLAHPSPLVMFFDVTFSNTVLSYSIFPITAPIPGSIVISLRLNDIVTLSP